MGRWFAAFFIAFVLMSTLSGFLAGGDGYAITALSGNENSSDATINVNSTDGFLAANSTFWIDNERMYYTGKTANTFTGVTRGYDSTGATTHSIGAKVYTEDANTTAYAMGFDIANKSLPSIGAGLITKTLPRIMQFNFVFLQGDLWFIGVLFYGTFAGFMLSLTTVALTTVTSILKR
jgi:hypothetical protein